MDRAAQLRVQRRCERLDLLQIENLPLIHFADAQHSKIGLSPSVFRDTEVLYLPVGQREGILLSNKLKGCIAYFKVIAVCGTILFSDNDFHTISNPPFGFRRCHYIRK